MQVGYSIWIGSRAEHLEKLRTNPGLYPHTKTTPEHPSWSHSKTVGVFEPPEKANSSLPAQVVT